MKLFLGIFAIILQLLPVFSQNVNKRIDVGLKGGFNSDICMIDEFNIGGNIIDYSENIYRVGLSTSLFMRLNLGKTYLQLEPSYHFSRGGLEFSFFNAKRESNLANLSWEFNSLSSPLLFGYHLIKEPPYGLNCFVGPKISRIFQSNNNFSIDIDNYPLKFDFKSVSFSAVIGIGLNISGLFFDFRYELGLSHTLNDITYINPFAENPFGKIHLKNRMNSMSFLLGYIF
ncbi:MAG: PorT family protein [Bacteroidales bacterium]|jgi:hypothetical protein|nr:PorT family protein [Bacteroidales bacterium]